MGKSLGDLPVLLHVRNLFSRQHVTIETVKTHKMNGDGSI